LEIEEIAIKNPWKNYSRVKRRSRCRLCFIPGHTRWECISQMRDPKIVR